MPKPGLTQHFRVRRAHPKELAEFVERLRHTTTGQSCIHCRHAYSASHVCAHNAGSSATVPRSTANIAGLIEGMDRDELLTLKAQIDDEMASIRSQIEKARAHQKLTGEYAHPDWYRRANDALRHRGRESQRIQIRMAKLRAERHAELQSQNPSDAEAFVRAARLILDRETYLRIWAEVNAPTTGPAEHKP